MDGEMIDTLNDLIEKEIARRIAATRMPLVYGVWIPGTGWLKDERTQRCFADVRIEVAEAAAKLYGADARVMPFDESLKTLEAIFLDREAEQRANAWRGWKVKLGLA
jgi:hypothetical protein